jgi:hypothetical protein
VHCDDAARVYRLALESSVTENVYHAKTGITATNHNLNLIGIPRTELKKAAADRSTR